MQKYKFGIAHRHMLVQGNLHDTTLHIHCLYTSTIHLRHLHLKDQNRRHTHLERFHDVAVPRQKFASWNDSCCKAAFVYFDPSFSAEPQPSLSLFLKVYVSFLPFALLLFPLFSFSCLLLLQAFPFSSLLRMQLIGHLSKYEQYYYLLSANFCLLVELRYTSSSDNSEGLGLIPCTVTLCFHQNSAQLLRSLVVMCLVGCQQYCLLGLLLLLHNDQVRCLSHLILPQFPY